MNLGVFVYRYNPRPWKWMSLKDGEHEDGEGREEGLREDVSIAWQHLPQAWRSVPAQYIFLERRKDREDPSRTTSRRVACPGEETGNGTDAGRQRAESRGETVAPWGGGSSGQYKGAS